MFWSCVQTWRRNNFDDYILYLHYGSILFLCVYIAHTLITMNQKQQTQRTTSRRDKKDKKLSQTLYDPDTGFEKFIEKQLQVDFIINDQKQKNDITLKIMTGKQKDILRIQVLSQADLFFYYEVILSQSDISQINSKHHTELKEMAQLAIMLEKNLQQAEKLEKQLCFQVKSQHNMDLKITKQINHKNFLVLSFTLTKLSDYQSNEIAAYRYGCLRQEIADFQFKIRQVKETVRAKNPYLLTFINKI